jgi:hypothetical protein
LAAKKQTTAKSENPIYDGVAAYLHPLLKSSERIGSVRALLMVTQWISQAIDDKTLKPTAEVQAIMKALVAIREDILLKQGQQ